MIEKLEKITELMVEIKKEDELFGTILLTNFQNSLDIILQRENGPKVDFSEKIKIITELLGFDLEELILFYIEKNNKQDTFNLNDEDDITKFIQYNLEKSNVDTYEDFLRNNRK